MMLAVAVCGLLDQRREATNVSQLCVQLSSLPNSPRQPSSSEEKACDYGSQNTGDGTTN